LSERAASAQAAVQRLERNQEAVDQDRCFAHAMRIVFGM